ncbi:MAG: DUF4339 domain-containing protein [Flavobacteriales bacterium]|nr:DUF4339 domain-containing protein [Flavobacteriales bacterium]
MKVIKIIYAIMLFACLWDLPYGYYQLVRFIGLVLFGYLAFVNYQSSRAERFFIFLILAILFQPIIKISFGREIWNIIDVVVGFGLIFDVFSSSKLKDILEPHPNDLEKFRDYHIIENNQKSKPLTFDQLKEKKITENTMIWRLGLENWVKAKDLQEVRNIIYHEPPPFSTIGSNTKETIKTNQTIEDKFIVQGNVYTLNELEEQLNKGNYILSKTSLIEVIQNEDYQNTISVTMGNYEPLKVLLKYFPPNIES